METFVSKNSGYNVVAVCDTNSVSAVLLKKATYDGGAWGQFNDSNMWSSPHLPRVVSGKGQRVDG